ncbi:uncharacterized protein LOC120356427 [Nilaparvata lugens]|uniref:uncharacterized protein LOC120356427 n=1 Tax=Nilaparvata lugens TaxID=108931 RepID=UPI00193DD20C|nr:uncharacterized protein LOC120356427 [Nilaparvata lugens]
MGSFLSGVVGEGEEVAVVFIIKQLIEVMTADGAELHMDANYKHLPEEPEIEQMLTIMVTHQDYAFPVVVAMMTKKSANLYYLILNHVKETIPDLAPQTIVSNHDSDLLTAIAEVFPQKNGTKNVVCWFHYTQVRYQSIN